MKVYIVTHGSIVVSASTDEADAKEYAEKSALRFTEASESEWRPTWSRVTEALYYKNASTGRWNDSRHTIAAIEVRTPKEN